MDSETFELVDAVAEKHGIRNKSYFIRCLVTQYDREKDGKCISGTEDMEINPEAKELIERHKKLVSVLNRIDKNVGYIDSF